MTGKGNEKWFKRWDVSLWGLSVEKVTLLFFLFDRLLLVVLVSFSKCSVV